MRERKHLHPRRDRLGREIDARPGRAHPDRFEVDRSDRGDAMSRALADAARRTRARLAVIADERLLPELEARLAGSGCRAATGRDALARSRGGRGRLGDGGDRRLRRPGAGHGGGRGGRTVALANKEALVTAGADDRGAARSGATILPVDSEHNAIFSALPAIVDQTSQDHPDRQRRTVPHRDRDRDARR